jgi:hypothetical protein
MYRQPLLGRPDYLLRDGSRASSHNQEGWSTCRGEELSGVCCANNCLIVSRDRQWRLENKSKCLMDELTDQAMSSSALARMVQSDVG